MQGSRMLWQFKMKHFLQTCNVEVSRALLSTKDILSTALFARLFNELYCLHSLPLCSFVPVYLYLPHKISGRITFVSAAPLMKFSMSHSNKTINKIFKKFCVSHYLEVATTADKGVIWFSNHVSFCAINQSPWCLWVRARFGQTLFSFSVHFSI